MRKTIGFIALSLLGATVTNAVAESTITKDREPIFNKKDVRPIDSTTYVSFDGLNKVTVGFIKKSNDARVSIYKNGILVYEDVEQVEKGTAFSYTISDDEGGEFNVSIETEGKLRHEENVTILQ